MSGSCPCAPYPPDYQTAGCAKASAPALGLQQSPVQALAMYWAQLHLQPMQDWGLQAAPGCQQGLPAPRSKACLPAPPEWSAPRAPPQPPGQYCWDAFPLQDRT